MGIFYIYDATDEVSVRIKLHGNHIIQRASYMLCYKMQPSYSGKPHMWSY